MSSTSSVVEVAIATSLSSSSSSATTSKKTTSSTSVLKTIKEQRRSIRCVFCNRWTVNKLTLGPLYSRDGVNCHYFCLLFCSNLSQKGEQDTDGILGFLTDDIKKEVKRVKGSKKSKSFKFYMCKFCKKPGATIGCFVKKCRMIYHFPCGLKNGVNFKFNSKFESYCQAHAGSKIFKPVVLRDCPVCTESLDDEDVTKPLVLGRCCSNSNLHKECMQYYALSAGSHHVKCPTCADKEIFIPDIKSQGIFVPEKDADWETENPNAYHELRRKYSHCDASQCLYPKGRDRHDKDKGSIWHLVRCSSCAASAVHVNCENLANLDNGCSPPKWFCTVCREVERRLLEKKNRGKIEQTAVLPVAEVVDEPPADIEVRDDTLVNVGVGDEVQVAVVGSVDETSRTVGVVGEIPANVRVDEIPADIGVRGETPANVGLGEAVGVGDEILEVVGGGDKVQATVGGVDETPVAVGVGDDTLEVVGGGDETQVVVGGGDETPAVVEVGDETQVVVGGVDETLVAVEVGDETQVVDGDGDAIPMDVGVVDEIQMTIEIGYEVTVNLGGCDETPAIFEVDHEISANVEVDNNITPNIEIDNEIPATVEVGDVYTNSSDDDDESCVSISSNETLFTTVSVVKRKISKPTHQTDKERRTTFLSVLKNESLGPNSDQEMIPSPPPSGIDEPTAPAAIPNSACQNDKEDSDDDDNSSVSSGGTLFSVVKKQSSKQHNNQRENSSSSPLLPGIDEPNLSPAPATQSLQNIKNETPVVSLSDSDIDEDARSDFSVKSSCSSDSGSDVSLFTPVEPPRKKRKTEEVTLPAFKISDLSSEDNDVKEIRCYCDRYTDEEPLIQCRRCSTLFHKRCRAGLYEIYGKTLHTRCCKICTDLPALKELQEIPLSGRYVPRGCENTRAKTYYMTLVKRGGGAEEFMVRRHDALYISEKGSRNVESSRILRVEKLWKNNRGTRFISGHYYFRPSETANADTRRFYRKEIFRASTPATTAIKMENVLGRCWILDPMTYRKGRPSGVGLDDEKHIFICESLVDLQTRRISLLELAHSMHSICMKPDAFKEFAVEMKIKKDYRVKGLSRGKQGSSCGPSSSKVVVLDSDSD